MRLNFKLAKSLVCTFAAITMAPAWAGLADIDTGFGSNGMVTASLGDAGGGFVDLYIDAQDRIYVLTYRNTGTSRYNTAVLRYTADGVLDTSYASNGTLFVPDSLSQGYIPSAIAVDAQNRLLIGQDSLDLRVYRLRADGSSLDPSFGAPGWASNDATNYDFYISDLSVQPDGKIVVGAEFEPEDADEISLSLLRFTANGAVDSNFKDARNLPGIRTYPGRLPYSYLASLRIIDSGMLMMGSTGELRSTPLYVLADSAGNPLHDPVDFTPPSIPAGAESYALEGRLRKSGSATLLYGIRNSGAEDVRAFGLAEARDGSVSAGKAHTFTAPSNYVRSYTFGLQRNGQVILGGEARRTTNGKTVTELALIRLQGDAALGINPPSPTPVPTMTSEPTPTVKPSATPGPSSIPTPTVGPTSTPTPTGTPVATPIQSPGGSGGGAFGATLLLLAVALRSRRR